MGWTSGDTIPPGGDRARLLTRVNIESLKSNLSAEWAETLAQLPADKVRDPRSGRFINRLSDDERQRLAALALLVKRGVVT
jgi:hypothetical protein